MILKLNLDLSLFPRVFHFPWVGPVSEVAGSAPEKEADPEKGRSL